MNVRTDGLLDSYALFSIQNEMKSTMALSGLSIYKTVLFVDGSDRAYSSNGVVVLADPYVPLDQDMPYMTVDTLNSAFGLNSSKRYSFNRECLLYCDAYGWQNGGDIGTFCILFDLKSLDNDIRRSLDQGYGVQIRYGDSVIYTTGEQEGTLYTKDSDRILGVTYQVYASDSITSQVDSFFYIILSGIVVISILFAILAFWESRKYYMPIDHLEQMIQSPAGESEDEMEKIICGIQELFYQIHRHIDTSMARGNCHVTMGVDILRDDIEELKQACEGALKALDGILTDGRGAVYFREDMEGKTNTYYFPVNFREKLKRCLLRQEKEQIHELLFDIYKTNADIAGTPEMYRALIDEFHLSVIKTLREITELNTVHLNIEKYTGLATLQDIFDYYDAALLSAIDALTDRFNVSNKYLSLLCRERLGTTYLQYIQNKRIQKAAELLRQKQYSLTEICSMCGYTNQLTFRRNFKRIMGMNPSDYQE